MAASLAFLNYFMPIFSFLFVFILVYALIKKTGVIGDNDFVALLISGILAVFFIVNASLVDFVEFSSAWIAVFFICIFFILVLIKFAHGDLEIITKNKGVAWVLLGLIISFFVISSAYVFNWAINWERIQGWFYTDWFGMVLLLAIAFVVAWVLAKK